MTSDLRSQLQEIYERRGKLTPSIVVDEARNEKHPLHGRFEWCDAIAGERFRRVQAADLIRSVHVVYQDASGKPQDVRAFYAVRRPTGHSYEPVEEIVEDEMATRILLADMERDWRAFKLKYKRFREFTALIRREVA